MILAVDALIQMRDESIDFILSKFADAEINQVLRTRALCEFHLASRAIITEDLIGPVLNL